MKDIEQLKSVKIIHNHFLPFPGYMAIMLFGTIFARKRYKPIPTDTVRHELIHYAQAKECGGWIRFYLKYFWL